MMNFLHILISLLFIFTFSCDDEPNNNENQNIDSTATDGGTTDGGTTGGGTTGGGTTGGGTTGGGTTGGDTAGGEDFDACINCIWLENDCNGNWFIAYNMDTPMGGFQILFQPSDIDNPSEIQSVSGGDAEDNNFLVSASSTQIIGFSVSGGTIPAGYGKLLDVEFNGSPSDSQIEDVIISSIEGKAIDVTLHGTFGIINCYYNSMLEQTGKSQLTIFQNAIVGLEVGDEIGVFDLQAITNSNDCSNQTGELLVGAGIWDGNNSQLNIVSIGSVDNCALDGTQLPGYKDGNDVIVRVWKKNENKEYNTDLIWNLGTGEFGETIQTISSITLTTPLSKRSF